MALQWFCNCLFSPALPTVSILLLNAESYLIIQSISGGWGGRGNQVFPKSQPKQSQLLLEGLQVPPFFPLKSSNTLPGKHRHESKEHSAAEQELQEGLPPWRCFWPSASLQLLSQAGRQEVVGSPPGRHGKDGRQGHGVTLLQRSTGLCYRKIEKAGEIHQEGGGGKELKQKESLAACQQRQPQLVVIW